VEQLRELDPKELITSEDLVDTNTEGRRTHAERYAQWMKEGKQAPPIDVVQTDSGKLKVTDGHRRLHAAKLAGKKILAWVSPRMDTGKRDSDGNPLYTGMTYEGMHGK
jgi:ParB-like chromosome segregation protein Spo0J